MVNQYFMFRSLLLNYMISFLYSPSCGKFQLPNELHHCDYSAWTMTRCRSWFLFQTSRSFEFQNILIQLHALNYEQNCVPDVGSKCYKRPQVHSLLKVCTLLKVRHLQDGYLPRTTLCFGIISSLFLFELLSSWFLQDSYHNTISCY